MVNFTKSLFFCEFITRWACRFFFFATFAVNYGAVHLRDNGTWLSHSCGTGNTTFTLARTMATAAWHHQPAQGQHFCLFCFSILFFSSFFCVILFCGSFYLLLKHWHLRKSSAEAGLGRTHPTNISCRRFSTLHIQFSRSRLLGRLSGLPAADAGESLIHCRRTSRFDWKCTAGPNRRSPVWHDCDNEVLERLLRIADPSIPAAVLTFEPSRNQKVHWSHRSSCRILFPIAIVIAIARKSARKGKTSSASNFAMLAHFSSALLPQQHVDKPLLSQHFQFEMLRKDLAGARTFGVKSWLWEEASKAQKRGELLARLL